MSTETRLERLERQSSDTGGAVRATVIVWIPYGDGISGVLRPNDRQLITDRGYVVKDSGVTDHGARTIQVFHDNTPEARFAAQAAVDALPTY